MVSNNLFNQHLMDKYIQKYEKEFSLNYSRKEALLKWKKKLYNGELKEEVANYGNFSRIILESLLGYDYDIDVEENKGTDYGSGRSEFILYKNKEKFMVIELKGSNTDLDKPQSHRKDNITPVKQGFNYVEDSNESLKWILVSNYDEFRLYNYEKRSYQYISFKIEELLNPEVFEQFMLIFSKFSTIENNLIEKMVSKTIFVERDLEGEFYKLYNETRLMLIAELEHLHPEFTREEAVHYAQLIMNRYIFICFAEDLHLLPEEISVETIENPVKNQDLGDYEIWHKLNKLFKDVDKGSKLREEEIYGYNGGLFRGDKDSKFDETPEFIESLKIRDIIEDQSIFKDTYQKWKFEEYSLIVEGKLSPYGGKINPIYKNLMTISTFNFSSEVDVNILGHIFENSIGEIEELKADTKGRRKKDGIFYTPEYITDYICRNTIIPYLSKSGKAKTVEKLIGEYFGSEINQLDEKVEKIKIVDPACGSGAFLNKASDILVEIHEAIHKYKYRKDISLMPYFDSIKERKKILLNNIYGVDLNEESVEITKLSLFLKVCRKGLKLPNLDKNIKCGDSIIDDPKYTSNPFNWNEEFKNIFDNGGFDIVIGNPPYVRQERIKEIKPYLKDNYNVYTGLSDLYVYFFERGMKILKKEGMFSFICANKFLRTKNDEPLRKFILKYKFEKYFDYTGNNVFEDVTTNPCIIVLKNNSNNLKNNIKVNDDFEVAQNQYDGNMWAFEDPKVLDLRNKLNKIGIKTKEIDDLSIYYGIKTGYDNAFIIDETTKDYLIKRDPRNIDVLKPLLRGRNIKRYNNDFKGIYLIYLPWHFPLNQDCNIKGASEEAEIEFEKQYNSLYTYFLDHKERLNKRNQAEVGKRYEWYALQRFAPDYIHEFKNEKIIWSNIANKPNFSYSNDGKFVDASAYLLTIKGLEYDIKYILANLNSNINNLIYKLIGENIAGGYQQWKKNKVEKLLIYPANEQDQIPFIKKVDMILNLNKELNDEINGFSNWLKCTYKIEKFSKKLDKYYELSLNDFLTELKKKKVDIKPRKTHELLKKEFEDSVNKVNPLLLKIEETDKEINQMIYKLYELSDDEIEIIESSL